MACFRALMIFGRCVGPARMSAGTQWTQVTWSRLWWGSVGSLRLCVAAWGLTGREPRRPSDPGASAATQYGQAWASDHGRVLRA